MEKYRFPPRKPSKFKFTVANDEHEDAVYEELPQRGLYPEPGILVVL